MEDHLPPPGFQNAALIKDQSLPYVRQAANIRPEQFFDSSLGYLFVHCLMSPVELIATWILDISAISFLLPSLTSPAKKKKKPCRPFSRCKTDSLAFGLLQQLSKAKTAYLTESHEGL